MGNFFTLSEIFEKKAKRFLKKYPTFRNILLELESDLITNPFLGKSLGNDIYKIRFSDKSKGKGKSGGFRAITYLIKQNPDNVEVILLTLYDQSEQDSIEKSEIQKIIKEVLHERNITDIGKKKKDV